MRQHVRARDYFERQNTHKERGLLCPGKCLTVEAPNVKPLDRGPKPLHAVYSVKYLLTQPWIFGIVSLMIFLFPIKHSLQPGTLHREFPREKVRIDFTLGWRVVM